MLSAHQRRNRSARSPPPQPPLILLAWAACRFCSREKSRARNSAGLRFWVLRYRPCTAAPPHKLVNGYSRGTRCSGRAWTTSREPDLEHTALAQRAVQKGAVVRAAPLGKLLLGQLLGGAGQQLGVSQPEADPKLP
jgi:hypothetical protein